MASNGSLNTKQRRAIAALIEARTIQDAAQAAGVGERTLYRWLEDPIFARELNKAEGNLIKSAVAALVGDMLQNFDVIKMIRDNTQAADGVRLRAASILDSSLLRWKEMDDLEERIARLEEAIYGNTN